MTRFRHVITSELTKIRTLRSTTWALLLTPLICVGLGYAVSLSLRVSFPRLPAQQRQDWDPLSRPSTASASGRSPWWCSA